MKQGQKKYIMKDYGRKSTFASFLPGIAGLHGIPIWCYYVNRGQGVVSFGVDNKDCAIMEFYPAHVAYQNVKRTGFRTFIRKNGKYSECFSQEKWEQEMTIGMNSLSLLEKNEAEKLHTGVDYFILPGERIGALVRMAVDGPKNAAGDDYTLTTSGINGWTVTLISKNCEQPERAIAFMDYMLSELGQLRISLGVEGETFDYVDGKPVVREEVRALLNTDRAAYDRMYGADDTYWMLQDTVMQLKWQQQPEEPVRQIMEWSYPYVVYNGQYDAFLPNGSREAYEDKKIERLWSETLPRLLLAESEEKFDRIFADFLEKRETYGFQEVKAAKTELMRQAKEKMGID